MNRLDHSQRLNDMLFAVVLTAAAACTGWIAAAQSESAVVTSAAQPVELERVVVVGKRESASTAAAAPIELPRVLITGKRIDNAEVARAASRDRNV